MSTLGDGDHSEEQGWEYARAEDEGVCEGGISSAQSISSGEAHRSGSMSESDALGAEGNAELPSLPTTVHSALEKEKGSANMAISSSVKPANENNQEANCKSVDQGTKKDNTQQSRASNELIHCILSAAEKLQKVNDEKEKEMQAKCIEIKEAELRAGRLSGLMIENARNEADSLKSVARELADKQASDIISKANATARDVKIARTDISAKIQREKAEWENEKHMIESSHNFGCTKIILDIGGFHFTTSLSTLTDGAAEGSLLAKMFSGRHNSNQDERDGSYFIDRDGTNFGFVLNYLRDPSEFEIPESDQVRRAIFKEAQYYQIKRLSNLLQYLPLTVFKKVQGCQDGPAAAGRDILGCLSDFHQDDDNPMLSTASPSDQIERGSMEEVLASVLQNPSSYEGSRLCSSSQACDHTISHHAQHRLHPKKQQGEVQHYRQSFVTSKNKTARMLLKLSFGESLVCYSSILFQLSHGQF